MQVIKFDRTKEIHLNDKPKMAFTCCFGCSCERHDFNGKPVTVDQILDVLNGKFGPGYFSIR
jgi:hypothetical protein